MESAHASDRAPALMATMAKHFGHKIPVDHGDTAVTLHFEMGDAVLTCDDKVLRMALDAPDAAAMADLRDVVERHLMRFAHREDPRPLTWTPA